MRRKMILLLILVAILGTVALLLTATPFSALVFGDGKGSPRYARKWMAIFEQIPDPEAASNQFGEVAAKRFENGEWIFGVASDSHGSHWGGTVVVKDSRGRARAFFTHVCGDGALKHAIKQSKSLEDFYRSPQFKNFTFTEYTIP